MSPRPSATVLAINCSTVEEEEEEESAVALSAPSVQLISPQWKTKARPCFASFSDFFFWTVEAGVEARVS